MNILRYFTPKSEIAYIDADSTVRQGLEKMMYHFYHEMPVVDAQGKYMGTVTEGDFLRKLYSGDVHDIIELEKEPLLSIMRRSYNPPIKVDTSVAAVLSRAIEQNFLPVVDDRGVFIGIVKRRNIIKTVSVANTKGA